MWEPEIHGEDRAAECWQGAMQKQDTRAYGCQSVKPLDRAKKKYAYPCTTCKGDANIGFSAWRSSEKRGYLIKPSERLCRGCAKKRGMTW